MKHIIISLMLAVTTLTARAQSQFQLVQHYAVPYTINPAFSGIENYLDIKVGTRQHLTKLPDWPKSNYAGININLDVLRSKAKLYQTDEATFAGHSKKGLSMFVMQDAYGPYSSTAGSMAYAYHLPLSRALYATLGVQVAYQLSKLDPSKLIPRNVDDPVYLNLLRGQPQQTNLDLNAGFALYGKHFYLGYAYFSLTGQKLVSSDTPFNNPALQTVQVGVNATLGRAFQLYLSGLGRQQFDTYYWDANAKLRYKREFWIGTTYRSSGSVAALLGFTHSKLSIHYSYELSTSSNILGNTHEITLGFMLFDYLNNKVYAPKPYFL